MRYLSLLFIFTSMPVFGFDFSIGKCKTLGAGEGFNSEIKSEKGRKLLWVEKFKKNKKTPILEKQIVFFVEDLAHCELHIISQNPSEVLVQYKMRHDEFTKFPTYDSLTLRTHWNFLFGERKVDNHFYRLAECTFSKMTLTPAYIKTCSKKITNKKIEYKEQKKMYWEPARERRKQTGGGILSR